MKPLHSLFLFLLGFSLIIGCSETNPLDEVLDEAGQTIEMMAKKKHPVPFKVRYTTTSVAPFGPPTCTGPGLTTVYHSGSGNATHMGNISVSATFCTAGSVPLLYDNYRTFVAANGDALFIYVETIYLSYVTPPNILQGNDTFVITGGTGRFAGATGQGTTVFTFDLYASPVVTDAQMDGEIMY